MSLFAVAVFALALTAIALDWAHRTVVALAGAGVMVLTGAIDQDHAIEAVDWSTLGLLAGMMIIVGLTERTGVFAYLALRTAQLSGGKPVRLVFLLAGVTGLLSAFLDNLTAILLIVPVTLLVAELLDLAAVPLVIITVLASNIGGTATLIGDPPNIMIGSHVAELSFLDFIVNLVPISVLTLAAATGLVWLFYRRRLVVAPERATAMAQLDPAESLREKPYLKRSLAILGGTVLLFFLHSTLHLEPAVVALTGATAMLLVATDNVESALERVDWSTIFFFIGLFVMVGALRQQGVIARVAEGLAALTGGSPARETLAILWGSAAGSALVDNIPFTAAMIPVVDHLQTDGFQAGTWWALALGACFGGNATLIAAAANVAASGLMQRRGEPITFLVFLRIGLPVTVLSLMLATGYLLAFHVS